MITSSTSPAIATTTFDLSLTWLGDLKAKAQHDYKTQTRTCSLSFLRSHDNPPSQVRTRIELVSQRVVMSYCKKAFIKRLYDLLSTYLRLSKSSRPIFARTERRDSAQLERERDRSRSNGIWPWNSRLLFTSSILKHVRRRKFFNDSDKQSAVNS